jgi:hypothetical protein
MTKKPAPKSVILMNCADWHIRQSKATKDQRDRDRHYRLAAQLYDQSLHTLEMEHRIARGEF